MRTNKGISLILFILLIFKHTTAQTWQDTALAIDKVFNQYTTSSPGCQASVSRNGELIFSKAYGMADLERNVILTTNSVLEAGSVSKQFTSAAILLLEQQGKLSLDDDVRKYIPELPDYGTPIKLRQMLHHTSGLRDWGSVAELTGWPRSTKFYTNEDALEIIARQKHLNNIPGAEYIYSNSNFNLFAIIVQRVSGLSLAAFTKKYIFEPAGMTHTQWRDDPNRIVTSRALAYDAASDRSYSTDMPNEYVYGNGGLLTTTEDLLKWNNYYLQGKLGSPSLLSKQLQLDALNNGASTSYAAGLVIRKVMGWDNISHSGATAGYRAYLETFPELHLSFAVLSNTSQYNIAEVATKLRKLFVTDKTINNTNEDSGINVSVTILDKLAGLYVNERDNSTFNIAVKNNTLLMDGLFLTTISENTFKANSFLLKFDAGGGQYISFLPADTMHFKKVQPVKPSPEELKLFAGNYFSEETNSVLTVRYENDKLRAHLNAHVAYQLIPTYKDAFNIDELGCDAIFIRDAQHKISIIKLSLSRARNVEFKKMK